MDFIDIKVPWYVRWLAIIALFAVTSAFAWLKGASDGATKLAVVKNEMVLIGKAQKEKYAKAEKVSSEITKNEGNQYEKGVGVIRGLYGPGRVLPTNPGSGSAAEVSKATGSADVAAANAGLGTGVRPPAEACEGLKSDAAVTTLQLLRLQNWIELQESSWNKLTE